MQHTTTSSSGRVVRSGFTLVELLIVVVILGILATMIIPRFAGSADDARRKSLISQMHTIREQIEMYKVQHNNQIPDLISGWTVLTTQSMVGTAKFGPYLPSSPVNPLNGSNAVADGDGSVPSFVSCGFIYDFAGGAGSGRIRATNADGIVVMNEQ